MVDGDHERFRSSLPGYLLELLPDDDQAWSQTHLATCTDCASLLERVCSRMPELQDEAGHVPVSVLEEYAHARHLTPLERELVRRHLILCQLCRGDFEAISGRPTREPAAFPRSRWRGWLTAGSLAAAAALIAILVRVQGSKPPPPAITEDSVTPAQGARPTSSLVALNEPRLRFPDQLRGGTMQAVAETLRGGPAGLVVQLPTLFLPGADSLELRILDRRGEVLARRLVGQEELAHEVRVELPRGQWHPGVYRLTVTPLASSDSTSPRTFPFRLIEAQR
jgi:hypothetical protein